MLTYIAKPLLPNPTINLIYTWRAFPSGLVERAVQFARSRVLFEQPIMQREIVQDKVTIAITKNLVWRSNNLRQGNYVCVRQHPVTTNNVAAAYA